MGIIAGLPRHFVPRNDEIRGFALRNDDLGVILRDSRGMALLTKSPS